MSKQIGEQQSPVTFKARDADIEILDEIAEEEGLNRSEKIRKLIKKEVSAYQADDGDYLLPEDDVLAEHYRRLVELAEDMGEYGLRVSMKRARNQLYSNEVPKDEVMEEIVRPLRKRGFANVDPGVNKVWITVMPLTEVGE
jgi:hypothetical protein